MADLARALALEKVRGLHDRRRSGILIANQGSITKGLFLRAGQIVFASSTVEKEKLGEALIRLGRISRADFAAAFEASAGTEGRKRLGQMLVGAGLMTEEELGRVVAAQVQKIAVSLFTWTQGDLRFHETAEPIPADLAVDLSTHRLLLEGARVFPDVGRLEKALGDTDRHLAVATRPPFEYDRVNFSPAEEAALAAAADGLTLSEMLERPQPRPLIVRAIYALWVGGVLEDPEHASGGVFEDDTGTFKMALPAPSSAVATAAVPAGPTVEELRQRLLALYEALPRATRYEVLGVRPDATADEIHRAHRRQEEEHERDWSRLSGEARLTSMISTLRLRQRDSFRVLSDEARRSAYDKSLGALNPPREAAADAEAVKSSRAAREAEALMGRGERDKAVSLLLEAVQERPGDLSSRRLLAVVLATHPTMARSAERHFLAALEMSPEDVELRYELAQYYKRAGLRRRAIGQLETVLEHDPGNAEASREVKILQRLESSGRR